MPVSLLNKWLDFYRLEPFGQEWENWLMARPAHMFAQVNSRKGSIVSVQDFMYVDSVTKKEQDENIAAENMFKFFDKRSK